MIVTITGPSCAGKTTLEAMLVERGLVRAISITTRPMRAGEVNGDNYYFISRDEFEDMQGYGELVECVEFGGNRYGLSVTEVKRLQGQGKPIVIVCEPVGQKQIAAKCKANGWPLYSVFVNTPESVIAERFMLRAADNLIDTHLDRPELVDGDVKTFARRMVEMMTTERKWVEEARHLPNLYSLRIDNFDGVNSEKIADLIASDALTYGA